MILLESISIKTSPTQVWEILADPSLMPLWNSKCTNCTPGSHSICKGSRYNAVFQMSGSGREVACEVIECAPEQFLKTRFTGWFTPRAGYVDEVFRLHASNTETRLVHEVDFTQSGIPWLIQVLMKLVSTFGYSVGKSPLKGIKDLAENVGAKSVQATGEDARA